MAVAATACSDGETAGIPSPTETALDTMAAYAQLNDAVAVIAEEQAALAPPMAELLSSLRATDRAVANLRDPQRIDGAVDAWPPVEGELDDAPLQEVRTAARGLAAEVDETRIELAQTRSSLDDEWERSYLDAQDEVLRAVRTYARTSDELAQVLAMHLPTYRTAIEESGAFVGTRDRYRSAEEASDAYEVEIGALLDELSTARQQIARFVEQRDDAAVEMNAQTAAAADVWARRPEDVPSPAGSAP